jgi:hypothetical protein
VSLLSCTLRADWTLRLWLLEVEVEARYSGQEVVTAEGGRHCTECSDSGAALKEERSHFEHAPCFLSLRSNLLLSSIYDDGIDALIGKRVHELPLDITFSNSVFTSVNQYHQISIVNLNFLV